MYGFIAAKRGDFFFTIASAMLIYVYLVIFMGVCSIRACSISKLLTPQQQYLLLFFLKLPVDQATSKIPPLCEQCWYTLDTGLLLKTKRPNIYLATELESKSNVEPSDILD